jgi:hypothetical protein
MSAPVAYVVTFEPAPDRDGIKDLRFLLKIAKRHLHLRAIDIREQQTVHRRDARLRTATITQRRNENNTMTINLRKYGPTNKWLKLEDFHGKPPRQERVGLVKIESGKYGERIVLVLEPSGQMLSLNQTSTGNLLRDFGATDDDWVGKLVEIYAGEVETKSGRTDAILVRGVTDVPVDAAIAAKAAKAKPATPSNDMDDTIPF